MHRGGGNAGGGGSTLVGPAWDGVCIIDTDGGHPRGRVGAHVVDTSGGRCWWVVHGVVAASSLQMGGESMLVGVLGVVSVLSTQAVVIVMGGGCPQGRVGAHVIDTTMQVGG